MNEHEVQNPPEETPGPDKTPGPARTVGYERRDLQIKPLVVFAGILIALAIVTYLGIAWLMHGFNARNDARGPATSPMLLQRQLPPEPRLEITESENVILIRQREDELLNNYAWVGRTTDTVRIPIERAMAIVAERGLPARTPAEEKK